MADSNEIDVPQSPETQSPDVREQLDQEQISHDGTVRSGEQIQPGTSGYMGAVESDVTPIMQLMRGPGDLVSSEQDGDDIIDPGDELTPG